MAQGANSNPTSPISAKQPRHTLIAVNPDTIIPLDASARTDPIHASIPSIKLPKSTETVNSATLNPITLQPFTPEELKAHNFAPLKEQYWNKTTPSEDAKAAHEEAIKDLREKLEENERKLQEVEREMEDKEKFREIERKVYMKKLGKDSG